MNRLSQFAQRLLFLVLVVLLVGCGGEPAADVQMPADPSSGSSAEPTPMPTRPAGRAVASDGYLASPYPRLALGFGDGASGVVAAIDVNPGDVVSAGELLARLETAELERSVAGAEQTLERAEQDQRRAQAQWERDLADAEQALADAQRSRSQAGLQYSTTSVEEARTALERAQRAEADAKKAYETPLFGDWTPDDERERDYNAWQGAIRERELAELRLADAEDSRGSSYLDIKTRESSVAQAERKLAALQEGVDPRYARAVEDAERELDKARRALAGGRLVAPWDALVLSVDLAPGATAGAGTPVVTLLSLEEGLRFVTQSLGEQHVTHVRPGQRAVVTLRSFAETPLEGVVEAVVPQVKDGTTDSTGAQFTVRVKLNPTDLELMPGLTGRVEIFTE